MRKMKIIFCVLLLAVIFVSCGQEEDSKKRKRKNDKETEVTEEATPTAEPTEEVTPTPTEMPLDPDADEDGDGASNAWEEAHGYDPRAYNAVFNNVAVSCSDNAKPIILKAVVSAGWDAVESSEITFMDATDLINDTIPGYIAPAFTFRCGTDAGVYEIVVGLKDGVEAANPTVYGLNPEINRWYAYETRVNGNVVISASTSEEGIYIVLDDVYEAEMAKGAAVDLQNTPAEDANNDGLSDYLTKLICDGIIRYSTGAKVFGNLTYEEVMANDDFNGDGIRNGEEIKVEANRTVPGGATEFNGHYYKMFDQGYIWDDVEAFCESWGGHLLTVTSEEEQKFIEGLLEDGTKKCYWLGANDVREEGTFEWVTGEPWEYENWAGGEPNNGGLEDWAEIVTLRQYGWNDGEREGDPNASGYSKDDHGFVCEWESGVIATGAYAVKLR